MELSQDQRRASGVFPQSLIRLVLYYYVFHALLLLIKKLFVEKYDILYCLIFLTGNYVMPIVYLYICFVQKPSGRLKPETLSKTMERQLATGPGYRSLGSKIIRDPACAVSGRGIVGGPVTCLLSSDVIHRASGNSPTATGEFISLKKMVFEVDNSGDQPQFRRIFHSDQAHKTLPCKSTKCKVCPSIDRSSLFCSSISGTYFTASCDATCATKNVIYLISCNKCSMQYVGETTQPLRVRFNQHRNAVSNKKKDTLIVRHFNQRDHSVTDMQIRVLQNINDCESKAVKGKLMVAEDMWIRLLASSYPFGLNNKVKGYGNAAEIFDPTQFTRTPYFCMPTPRRNRGHGAIKKRRASKKNTNIRLKEELKELLLDTHKPADIRNIIVFLRKQTRGTLLECNRLARDNSLAISALMHVIILAFLAGYFSHKKDGKSKPIERYYLSVDFPNKGMEFIGLNNIFKDRQLNRIIPQAMRNKVKPVSVVFKYLPPFSRKLCNYSVCLRQIMEGKTESYVGNCNCETSPFLYPPAGHVVTGNLEVVPKGPLRDLFAKGAKYRIPKDLEWTEVQTAATRGIVRYTEYLIRKKIITGGQAILMQERFMKIVSERIRRHRHDKIQDEILHIPSILRELKTFHSHFVVTVADKASNNFVIVCKKLYFKVLCDELGVSCVHNKTVVLGNDSYKPVNESVENIIKRHKTIAQKYGISVSSKDCVLPRMFAIPKLHKSPYGWRFISGARKSSTKQFSVRLHIILSYLKKHFANYCRSIERNTGQSRYWSVDNSLKVKDRLLAFSTKKAVDNCISADFSTLFTTLPHDIIRKSVSGVINLCFKNSGKTFVCVNGKKVFYTNDYAESGDCYPQEEIIELVNDVINETYVQFAGHTFRQICGIPMGNNSAPTLADITLSFLEFVYLNSEKKEFFCQRFIDDLLAANQPDFMQIASEIYPAQLPLNRTNERFDKTDFLDLVIKLNNGRVTTSVYNKTDYFPFRIVKYGFSSSNVHSNVGLGIFYSQIIRYARISDLYDDFERRVSAMFMDLLAHGFSREKLICKFYAFANRYKATLSKFGLHDDQAIILFVQKNFFR